MTRCYTYIESPVGVLTLVAEADKLCGLFMHQQRHRPDDHTFGPRNDELLLFAAVTQQLGEYFEGERTDFDVALQPQGQPFQLEVWRALCTIPYGKTASYGEIAAQIGRPGAARAVGTINGQNPISIIVPCHRVIGANGDLVGYGGGLERKQFLLELETAHDAPKLFA